MVKKEQNYNGSVVLGLNDALVEISGALVGLTFAFADSKIIATVGLITGFAAALSMAASAYLSAEEDNKRKPLKRATYTGITYLIAVIILVLPYLILDNPFMASGVMFVSIIGMIAIYAGHFSRVRNTRFKSKFFEMLIITLSVSAISFVFGNIVKSIV